MNDTLARTLKQLRLSGLLGSLEVRLQEAHGHGLNHAEFLELILQDELAVRGDRQLQRRLKAALFRELKVLDDFDWSFNPSIRKKQIYELATCRFVREARDVLFLGPPGVGKSFLVQALGYQAVKAGFAVLYRSNAQSRVFEEAFLSARVPYRVYGGLRFFERAEIKDALAYLRLIANRRDDASFERVVNLPPRGIGAKSLDAVREAARGAGSSLWEAAAACIASDALGSKAAASMHGFMALIERLARETAPLALHEQVDQMLKASGLIEHHRREKADRGEARVENLEELVSAARGFMPEGAELPPLESFLANAALEAGEGQAHEAEDGVQMMTLHNAKGLEFPVVFLTGLEEGLFPHQRSLADLEGLEEERRLCYVGMTRAMRQLYLSYAEQRRLHGIDSYGQVSRFVREVPEGLIEEVRPRVQVSRPIAVGRFRAEEPEVAGVRLGARVRHGKFGDGVILNVEGSGAHARVQVNFERQGTKWLMVQYANLQPL